MNKHLITLLAVSLGIQTTCLAVDLPQIVETSDGFTLHMPSDWSAIPRDAVAAYGDAIAKRAPKAEKQIYNYGFQLAAAQHWFEYPYILVQVKRTGRVPEGQLKSIKQVSRAMDEGLGKAQYAMSSFASDARLGETTYDPQTHILWTQMSVDVKDVGRIRGLFGVVLTEAGVINIYGYAKEKDFAHYLPIFETIIKNTMLSDSLRYKPRTTDSIPVIGGINWGNVLRGALTGVIIGGLVALVAGLARKRKTPNQPSDPAR